MSEPPHEQRMRIEAALMKAAKVMVEWFGDLPASAKNRLAQALAPLLYELIHRLPRKDRTRLLRRQIANLDRWPGLNSLFHALTVYQRDLKAATARLAKRDLQRRRRAGVRQTAGLSPQQVEAVQLVGEHKGNFAAAARAAGKSRTAMAKLYEKANRKLGKKAIKHATQRLPRDQRGQETIADDGAE